MITLGLTGSIGMGKSTTAGLFAEAGAPVYDADAAVHAVYARGGAAVAPVEEAFAGVVVDGAVDRGRLSARVLNDPEALRRLEAIVHPLLGAHRAGVYQRALEAGAPVIVLDVPLLFETGGDKVMDAVAVVSAPPEVQRARVLERPGMTEAKFDAILARQLTDADKRARADFVIDTSRGLEPAREQVAQVLAVLRDPAWTSRRARSDAWTGPPGARQTRPMAREIVLDTETTGIDPRTGHRVVEIACVEIEDLIPTGRTFQRFVNPERDIDPEAEQVHGLSRHFLRDHPRFDHPSVCDAFLAFIGEATLVAHNAAFDRGFVNAELERVGRRSLPDHRWTCTLMLAQQRFPNMYNSLDALCKRYRISLAEREKHGALIDTKLLALVYLELRGGRERALALAPVGSDARGETAINLPSYGARPRPLPLRSTQIERAAHAAFVAKHLAERAVWGRSV